MPFVQKPPYIYLQIGNDWYRYLAKAAPIGSGAMGAVYVGADCKTGQKVAIKLVHKRFAEIPSIRQRARQEAALSFMHNNLIEMLGVCEAQPGKGPIWIVSRFVQGTTVDKFLSYMPSETRTYQKVCQLFLPVLDALTYLHSKNILHLDIKPSNIMVENDSNVRLMDLGIATDQNGAILGSQGMLGTPNFAAPEQLVPHSTLDARTDIYEAAVTLYELITGTNPYSAGSTYETIQRHNQQMLVATETLPQHVCDVLVRAACPNPEERYSSAAEFKQALQAAIAYQPKQPWWKLW